MRNTSVNDDKPPQSDDPVSPPEAAATRAPGRRFGITLGTANFGMQLVVNAVPQVLIAMQIEDIDPDGKEFKLGLLAAVAATLVTITQPAWGIVSDRTRSRYGRRAPYIVGGALACAVALLGLAVTDTFLGLLLAWCAASIALTATTATLGAALPDRVPEPARGAFASVIGLGGVLGAILGQLLVAKSVGGGYLLPYAVIALIFVGTAIAYAVVSGPEPRPAADAARFSWRELWVDPRAHPDFAWVFLGRLLVMTGFIMVNGYLLYILGDHVGLGRDRALHYLPVVSAVSAVAVVISLAVSGIWSDRAGRRKPFVFGAAVLLAAGLALLQFAASIPAVLACVVVVALGYGAFRSLDEALISLVLPSTESAAQHVGLAHVATHLAAALGPALAGLIIGSGGGYAMFFATACTVTALGSLCILPIRSVR